MKLQIKNSANRFGLIFLVLIAAIFLNAGCATHPDPLAGWKPDFHEQPSKAIENDFTDYIQKENLHAYPNDFLEDQTGQHAIVIDVGINGTSWRHILIYDKNDKRIKTLKYSPGGYRS